MELFSALNNFKLNFIWIASQMRTSLFRKCCYIVLFVQQSEAILKIWPTEINKQLGLRTNSYRIFTTTFRESVLTDFLWGWGTSYCIFAWGRELSYRIFWYNDQKQRQNCHMKITGISLDRKPVPHSLKSDIRTSEKVGKSMHRNFSK